MSDYTDDFVDIEPFEGEPDFTSSAGLEENVQDDMEDSDA